MLQPMRSMIIPHAYTLWVFLGADQMILFNAGDIEEVTFIGSQDEEELKFRKYMEGQVEKFIQETRSSSESND